MSSEKGPITISGHQSVGTGWGECRRAMGMVVKEQHKGALNDGLVLHLDADDEHMNLHV